MVPNSPNSKNLTLKLNEFAQVSTSRTCENFFCPMLKYDLSSPLSELKRVKKKNRIVTKHSDRVTLL